MLKAHNGYVHKQNNCDSGEPGYVQLSNGLIQSCETCHTFAVEYAQVTVDRFHENIIFIPCSVMVCLALRHFSCVLKDCIAISIFG